MRVIKNDMIVHCDVDDTIVLHRETHKDGKGKIAITDPYDGEVMYLTPHRTHIKLLKQFKKRGYYVVLWSGAGWAWSETVAKALKLEKYIDECMTKNVKFMDDLQAPDVLGSRIYLEHKDDK
jgi:hypothetical protein